MTDTPLPPLSEDLLKSSEEQFRAIANYIPALVWLANADGWIYWYNRRWFEYTGTTPKQMEGWGWQSVHDPAVLPAVLEKWTASIASGEPFEMAFPLRGADGQFRAFLTRVNSVRDDSGKVIRWIGTNVDISGQRAAEALLLEKDTHLRAAFRQSYAFMVLLRADGTILEANEAALQAIAADRAAVNGKKFWEPGWWGKLPEERVTLRDSVRRAADGKLIREECRYMLADGTVRFAERTLSPIKEDDGAIRMVVATGIDTTEQKELRERLEDRVRARTADLKEKNDQLADLSGRLLRSQDEERSRIARDLHDSIGQLLSALGMNIALVSTQIDKLSPGAAAAVRENQGIVEQITSEIRTISHLLHPPLLDELGVLTTVRDYAAGFTERSNIKVSLDFPPVLEAASPSMDLAIFRIIQECLTNIYRHSRSKTAFIQIAASPERISVQVRDEGKGLPPEARSGSAEGKFGGVGLSGMRERVREFGGTLDIQSSSAGAIVTATFPLKQAADALS
ncbi:MAG TPA: PAS domain S-box protein [Candidatus Acidoferrum sp.]